MVKGCGNGGGYFWCVIECFGYLKIVYWMDLVCCCVVSEYVVRCGGLGIYGKGYLFFVFGGVGWCVLGV